MAKLKRLLPYLGAFLLGAGLIGGLVRLTDHNNVSSKAICGTTLRNTESDYKFIKPLLACDVGATVDTPSLAPLKNKLTTLINSAKAAGQVSNASLYFRDLDQGDWTEINGTDAYQPASLFKVPLLIAYLKIAEDHPEILGQKITVTTDSTKEGGIQSIPPAQSAIFGQSYSVADLLRLMIVYSDNSAKDLLTNYVDINVLDQIFTELAIPFPNNMTSAYTLTARSYSRFFRTLYNSSYLSDPASEYALSLLSDVVYADGLRAGVPADVKIAHKFGEANITLANGQSGQELHDCGIVYDSHPYLICIMTRGTTADPLAKLIATLSQTVYEFRQQK